MKVFVDTGAFIALADKSDKHVVQSIKIQEKLKKQKSKLIISEERGLNRFCRFNPNEKIIMNNLNK